MNDKPCTWCYGSGQWVEGREVVACAKCEGTGRVPAREED